MIKAKKVELYAASCDNCGRLYEGPDYEWYFDEDELLEDAEESGWVGLFKGKKEPEDYPDDVYLSDADQHFCCERCRDEWLEKHAVAEPKGKFCPAPDSGDGPLPLRDCENAQGVSYVADSGVSGRAIAHENN